MIRPDQVLRLLQNVPQNVCVFCGDDVSPEGTHPLSFEVLGRRGLCCHACVEYSTDLRSLRAEGVLHTKDVLDEFVQSQNVQCYCCHRLGATVLCPGLKECGRKFHRSCRLREPDDSTDRSRCSKCAETSQSM